MTDLTLPGTMDGLLLRGSPVLQGNGTRMIVTSEPSESPERWTVCAGETNDDDGPVWCEVPAADLALDLRDPTGRAHAAWWAGRLDWHARVRALAGDSTRFAVLRRLALDGDAMTDDQIGRFRDLCQRLEAP